MAELGNGENNIRLNWREILELHLSPLTAQLERVEKTVMMIDANMTTRTEMADLKVELHKTNDRIARLEKKLEIAQWIFNAVAAVGLAIVLAYINGWLG